MKTDYKHEVGLKIFYALILVIGYIVFLVLHTAVIASTTLLVLLGFLICNPRCGCLQFTLIVLLGLLFWVYNLHGSYASRSPWLLRLYPSKGGRSSCTNQAGVPFTFNPHGLAYSNVTQLDLPHSFCPYLDLRFADNTGEEFTGTNEHLMLQTTYEPCTSGCIYASQFKEDYESNPGKGIIDGWFPLKDYRDTQLCPKMTYKLNQFGVIGVGQHLHATCTWTLNQVGQFPAQDSYATKTKPWTCPLCPGYNPSIESADPSNLRFFCTWCLFWLVTVVYWTVASWCRPVMSRVVKRY